MAGGYAGEVTQFTETHKKVADNKQTIDTELSGLRDNMEATSSGWQGAAAQGFRTLMERYDEDCRKLSEALQGIADLLQQAGSQYQAQEDEHAESMSGIMNTLG